MIQLYFLLVFFIFWMIVYYWIINAVVAILKNLKLNFFLVEGQNIILLIFCFWLILVLITINNVLQIRRIIDLLSDLLFKIFIFHLVLIDLNAFVILYFIKKFFLKLTLYIITIIFKMIYWCICNFRFFNCWKNAHILWYFLKILATSLNFSNIYIRLIIF